MPIIRLTEEDGMPISGHQDEWSLNLSLILQEVAEKMVDYSGADIECVCREAGMAALHVRLLATDLHMRTCSTIKAQYFEEAIASVFP